MKVLIIGNGLAGIIAAKTIREAEKEVEIDIYTDEKYHYYPRPNLIEFVAGNLAYDKLFAFSGNWYEDHDIRVHLSQSIKGIHPDSQEIELESGKKTHYDKLLVAGGAFSFLPPFKGTDKQGLFSLRTLDDAQNILEYQKNHKKALVIGGGLLGLEIARALRSQGAEVQVVEYFPLLLPRQLDEPGAALLKKQIENMGISVHLGVASEEILGAQEVSGIKIKEGEQIQADMAVVAAGVRPNIQLCQSAGIQTDKGVVVNDTLQTSHPHIYAAGDIAQHQGRLYGIIPATFQQARIAAMNILGQKTIYEPTVPSNTLKVMGIHLTSIGIVKPEDESFEEYGREISDLGIYKKIVVRNGVIEGAIWMGTKIGVNEISRAISERINIENWKDSILEDDFDFSMLF